MQILKLQNIQKNFGTQEVLKDINLEMQKGEIIAITGASGSGKSTLLQIIGLLDNNPITGELFLERESCLKKNESWKTEVRKNKIGFLFQFHNLLPEFTVLENCIMPLLIKRQDKLKAEKKALELLETVGLGKMAQHIVTSLSGGEQQRIALVRSIITTPLLLLADEPTGNLDKKNSETVIKLLITQAKKHNHSTIMVTHDLNLAKNADRIFNLEKGKLHYVQQ